jgi:hypothetical protein
MTNHGATEENTGDWNMWRNVVLGEEKPLASGQSLDIYLRKHKGI